MGLRLTLSFAGDIQLARELGILASRVQDLSPAYTKISKDLNAYHVKMFNTRGAHDGHSPWAKLRPTTIARKGHDKPLIDTKRMMKAFTKDNAEGAVREIGKRSMEWGLNADAFRGPKGYSYPELHQVGTSRMPARPPFRLSEAFRKKIIKTIQAYLVKSGQFEREAF